MGERLSIACISEVKTPLQELGGQRGDIFVVKLKQLRQVGHYGK